MEMMQSLAAFAALAQPTRLETFRLLIRAGEEGRLAGEIAAGLGVRQNTLSTNLSVLLNAGLIQRQREGRMIRYFADMDGLRAMLGYLLRDCCGGQPDLCDPLIDDITSRNSGVALHEQAQAHEHGQAIDASAD